MDNFFQNNIPNMTANQRRKQELQDFKSSITDLKYQKELKQLSNGYVKSLKGDGFVQVVTLSAIVFLVGIVVFLLIYFTMM